MKTIFFTLLLFISYNSFGQEKPLTNVDIKLAVDSLTSNLNRIYVFPEVAEKMSEYIKKKLAEGKYDLLTNPQNFSDQITKDIQSISNDKHLNFRYAPRQISEMRNYLPDAAPDLIAMKKEMGRNNFGFKEIKILPGNIGYIKFNGFEDASIGGEAATAAMNFVSYTDAIIFDLRENGGGSPSMIQLLMSYLYEEGENIHLNNFYFRPNDETVQTWTLPYVSGKRNPTAQVYVLTSNYTFSAAEEFTYNLQNLNRGTIVGEVTGGGAHPGGSQIITDLFLCFIPNGRAINPITKTNWEGVGITPNVTCKKENALDLAHALALDSLMKTSQNEEDINHYKWHTEIVKNKANPYSIDTKKLKYYSGKFGSRNILFENNKLIYQRDGRPKYELVALSETLFYNEEIDIKIQMNLTSNKIQSITVLLEDGRKETNDKN